MKSGLRPLNSDAWEICSCCAMPAIWVSNNARLLQNPGNAALAAGIIVSSTGIGCPQARSGKDMAGSRVFTPGHGTAPSERAQRNFGGTLSIDEFEAFGKSE
jgi:hypothetical protein